MLLILTDIQLLLQLASCGIYRAHFQVQTNTLVISISTHFTALGIPPKRAVLEECPVQLIMRVPVSLFFKAACIYAHQAKANADLIVI